MITLSPRLGARLRKRWGSRADKLSWDHSSDATLSRRPGGGQPREEPGQPGYPAELLPPWLSGGQQERPSPLIPRGCWGRSPTGPVMALHFTAYIAFSYSSRDTPNKSILQMGKLRPQEAKGQRRQPVERGCLYSLILMIIICPLTWSRLYMPGYIPKELEGYGWKKDFPRSDG